MQEPLPAEATSWWSQQDPGQLALYGVVVAVVVLVLVGWRYQWPARIADWWRRTRVFLTEVRSEMKKVTFPSRGEVMSTTWVVLITSFVFAAFLYGADVIITFFYRFAIERLGL